MSQVWLIRHGQAGLRSNYDTLSATGAEQARLLGEWLRQGHRFDHVVAGGLNRQQETARLAGYEFVVDAGWSEFDLDAVYREIAPQIAAVDAAFREEYEALQRDVADDEHPVHRKWTRGDVMVVRAWIDGTVPVRATETFGEFRERVSGAFARLLREREGNVAVFTSATPIALALAGVLGVGAGQAMRLAGALMNASCSVVRAGNEPSLFGFNHAAHLPPELHTFR